MSTRGRAIKKSDKAEDGENGAATGAIPKQIGRMRTRSSDRMVIDVNTSRVSMNIDDHNTSGQSAAQSLPKKVSQSALAISTDALSTLSIQPIESNVEIAVQTNENKNIGNISQRKSNNLANMGIPPKRRRSIDDVAESVLDEIINHSVRAHNSTISSTLGSRYVATDESDAENEDETIMPNRSNANDQIDIAPIRISQFNVIIEYNGGKVGE